MTQRSGLMLRMLLATALMVLNPGAAGADDSQQPAVWFDQRLGQQVPMDVVLQDEQNRNVTLEQAVDGLPTILVLVYYRCPMLCTLVLNSLVESLREVNLQPGRDFSIVAVSIDPRENAELAAAKKQAYLQRYDRDDAESGWHLLTGHREPDIRRITDAVGYGYSYDQRSGQYAHPSGLVILTPAGVVSQYFMGLDYPSRSLRLSLVAASHGSIGSLVDQILLRCFQFDPISGQYSLAIINVLRAAGTLTLLALGGLVAGLIWMQHKRQRQAA